MISSAVPADWPDGGGFYASPNWLRFVDSEGVGRAAYVTADGGALVAHHCPDEGHPDYRFESLLRSEDDRPRLLIGGRRGFCSAVLGEADPAALISAALDEFPEVEGRWWWPYLPTEDVLRVVEAAASLTAEVPGVHLVDADCVVDDVPPDAPFTSIMSKTQQRTNWNREWRRFLESGLELRRVSIDDIVENGPRLLQQVEHKYGNEHQVAHLRTTLARQARHLRDETVAHAAFAGDDMVGYSLAYRGRDELAVRSVGLDYSALRNGAEYAALILHGPVQFAQEHGIERIHVGTRSYEAKCRRGARARALWAVAPGTRTSPAANQERAVSVLSELPTEEATKFQRQLDDVHSSVMACGGTR